MGLDITAYERIELVPEHPMHPEYGCVEMDVVHRQAYLQAWVPGTHGSLLADRCYEVTGETIRFRAGSYGGYNIWRAALSAVALGASPEQVWETPDLFAERPFFLLVNFSDCEGTIGPEACAKLADDFDAGVAEVRPVLAGDYGRGDQYAELYDTWRAAFRLAAGTGMLDFH